MLLVKTKKENEGYIIKYKGEFYFPHSPTDASRLAIPLTPLPLTLLILTYRAAILPAWTTPLIK